MDPLKPLPGATRKPNPNGVVGQLQTVNGALTCASVFGGALLVAALGLTLVGCRSEQDLLNDPWLNAVFNGYDVVHAVLGEEWMIDGERLTQTPPEAGVASTIRYDVSGPGGRRGSVELDLTRPDEQSPWSAVLARVAIEREPFTSYVPGPDGAWVPAGE